MCINRRIALIGRILFFAVFLALLYSVQRFWFLRAWNWIHALNSSEWRTGLEIALIAAFVALFAALFDSLLGHVVSRAPFGKSLITFSRIWIVTSLFALIAVKSVAGIEWSANLVSRLQHGDTGIDRTEFDASRRTLFRYAAYLAGSIPFAAATYGFAAGRLRYSIERVDVPVANLPPELDGLRIAQLSDIHIGDYMPPEEIARAVSMANDLKPDLAVVTGDFVSSEGDPLDVCVGELAKLRAPLGVWGCNGNHEIYAGVEDDAARLFHQNGMRLLRAQNAVIERNGARFNLLGVDYQRDHMVSGERTGPMLAEIEHLVRSNMPNILLSHNPNSFPRAAELGIELSLAGHTHGGQVKVEIVDHSVTPARLISPFVAGLYRREMRGSGVGSQVSGNAHGAEGGVDGNSKTHDGANGTSKAALYVNRGLGTFGFPVRLGVPPEITLLTLRRA
ncbi:MAG TPA: metallophosphoesterase [Terriglobales bacterium]|nr:metallophosphoesterase [Terriglobales bacterium]